MKINDPKPEPWLKRRERDVAWAGVLAGPGYLYRPGEVLFASAAEQLLRRRLDEQDGRPAIAPTVSSIGTLRSTRCW